ncbi:type II secretion system F family protein [Burkholderia thailandensis]|uniref:Type II secretion system (T2SS), F family protein n=1 Tax=Burkholderia thailandensis TaxID=57975 RepID=A0AAW9CS31_BURTH|nr:type II secretion system F family protein [Burkholderia thailandensis]AHI63747.1 type II secretion system (T2SS), F family protein [Burkholderia thailandensis H0587]AIP64095.1 type II secretion system protein [Burkholderia thailandensis]AJY28501.1 type II secretion system (T2SS), F family protein [Burkholderia thailandensis 34]AOI50809.1 type II secretion system protein [Burkholderia thailandensis]AOJ49831.1 type II secretion system protein [Burkholderia thailandensis]
MSTHSPAAPLEARYRWTGVTTDGVRRRGMLVAVNPSAARAALKRSGVTVLHIEARGTAPQPTARAGEVTRFARQLAGLLHAGLALAPSLELLAQATRRNEMPRIAAGLAREIVAGRQFSAALRRYPRQFDPFFCQLVAVGETAGALAAVLARLADDRERAAAQYARVRGALAYPVAVLLVALAITAALLIWVVPTFEQIFAGFGAALPAPTRFVLALSAGVTRWSAPVAAAMLLAGVAARRAVRRSAIARVALAQALLRAPFAGPLVQALAAARWSRALGTLLAAGTPLTDAFTALSNATGNPRFDLATARIAARLQHGERLARAMRAEDCFADDLVQPIAVAEESGTLDAMLIDVATLYDRRVDEQIGALANLCEPVVIVVLGALIGALVVAMYLPIVQLGNVV